MISKEHKSADFAYNITEKIAYKFFAPIFYKFPFTPNQITFINFLTFNMGATVLFALGKYWANLVSIGLITVSTVLDWMDGAVARKRDLKSKAGAFLDHGLDSIWQIILVAGIVFGVYLSSEKNVYWLMLGFLSLLSLVFNSSMGQLFENEFGFGFYGDYEEIFKKMDSSKKTSLFDKLCLEMLTYRKFPYIFLFTIRYPLLLGAIFNRLDWFLVLLLATCFVRGASLFYLYFIYLKSEKIKVNSVMVEALIDRYKFWLTQRFK